MTAKVRFGALAALALAAPLSYALEFDLGEFGISFNNRFSLGAMWRIEDRDPNLIAKLNLDPSLCAGDDCISFTGNPEPNQRLVDAPGAFFGDKVDDGNLNYDKGDIVAGLAKLTSDLSVSWRDFSLKARGIFFYDQVNANFDEFHPNNVDTAPAGAGGYQPAFTERGPGATNLVGEEALLQDLVLSGFFFLGDRGVSAGVGYQKLRWGEANLIALNSINEINPPDARFLRMPGGQINEVFQPVLMATLSGDLFPEQGITGELFYQLEWKRVTADVGGSFFGEIDALYRRDEYQYAAINLGFFPEDPLVFDESQDRFRGQHRLQNPLAGLLTTTSFSAPFLQTEFEPRDEGQYGVRLNWFADNFNGGTEFGFYYMNYHSRLPYLSFLAADKTPLRDGTGTGIDVLTSCTLAGNDCLPIDTATALLDYPEDIQMYGISFNTNVGSWSVAGEYSFRPNVPVQVSVPDVFFAALQPALPQEDIAVGLQSLGDFVALGGEIPVPVISDLIGGLGGTLSGVLDPIDQLVGALTGAVTGGTIDLPLVVPGARAATPDFVETVLRGTTDIDAAIAERGENYYIPGFERQKVGQFAMTGIRILGNSHPISSFLLSEQIITLVEVGFTHIVDMPSMDLVQFDGNSPNRTHFSPGADGTGQVDGEPDPRSLNPTQQTEAFVDDFAWGYRILTFLEYNDVVFGLNFKPFLSWFHDVQGYAPGPMQNFLEGRKEWMVGTEVFYGQNWSAKVQYNGHDGNRHNIRRDRDNVLLELSYTF